MKNNNQLTEVIKTSGVKAQTGEELKKKFVPFIKQADEWSKKANKLVITDPSQTYEMGLAREGRLALKQIRINADKLRKALKEDSLKFGRAVQGIYNEIELLIAPIEKHLLKQENFVKIQEEKERLKTKLKREAELEPYQEFIPYNIDLAEMSPSDYKNLLNGAKLQQQEKIANEKKAEKERLAKIKADEIERKRVVKENEQLRKEYELQQKQREKERLEQEKKQQELEAELEAERTEKQGLADLKRQIEEDEAAKIKETKEAERVAKAAPDKDKLLTLADLIDNIDLPKVNTPVALQILDHSENYLYKISGYIRTESNDKLS